MAKPHRLRHNRPMQRRTFLWITALAATLSLLAALGFPALERHYLRQQAIANTVPLNLAVEGLRSTLDRYAPLPALIAERPALAALLSTPDNQALQASVNERLRQTATTVDASDIFLMDITGRTIAAASYRATGSYVDRNFSYQPYFNQALGGGLASFSVYGTTTGERGYFYAAPVEDGNRIVGVLAVKFNINAFESIWRGADSDFIVSDRNAFVFMASRPDWHFRALRPISPDTLRVLAQNRQFPIDRIDLLPVSTRTLGGGFQHFTIEGDRPETFVMSQVHLDDLDWTMSSLLPTAPARLQAFQTLAITGLVILLALTIAAVIRQNQIRQADRLSTETNAKRALETAVAARTADLSTALADLKRTQTDLIQAGKLAGLGQMSAALSHEFNQPLAAVKSYADNAATFLDRDNAAQARANLTRISAMVDRMASISKHLRNFARRPGQATTPVLLNQVITDAIAVLDVRLTSDGARIDYTSNSQETWVTGGHVRLQQVIVNLMTNALDAMAGQANPTVTLTALGPTLTVRDTGPGIDPAHQDHLFDPFFTTKPTGQGLGLGLSISYNIVTDFGGTLTGENHPDGGAIFTLTLQTTQPTDIAAQ